MHHYFHLFVGLWTCIRVLVRDSFFGLGFNRAKKISFNLLKQQVAKNMKIHRQAIASLAAGGAFTFFLATPIKTSHAVEIQRISDTLPGEDAFARRVKVDANGECFFYEGDMQYHYYNQYNETFGKGCKHVWKTCGVFSDTGEKEHTLLSTLSTANCEDDDFPTVSDDGSKVCYHTKDIGSTTTIAVVDTKTHVISYITMPLTDDYTKRKSTFCDISPDGEAIVFQSSAHLVEDVSYPSNKYQVYVSYDHGKTFTLVAGAENANKGTNLLSSYPQSSKGGERITFQTKIPYDDLSGAPVEQKQNELFLYSKDSNTYERLTNFNENHCNLTEVYKLMQDYWGAENLLAEGITKGSNTQCILAAMKGLGGSYSGNQFGAGHGPARISNSGRFIAYTAGFDHANIRGTHEFEQIITAANLFLHDTTLGLIWQLTGEGNIGSDIESRVESFCCESASSSYQRGTCSKMREYRGLCCWQRPCWFPAQWPDISGDGSSIVFFSASDDTAEVAKDYEIVHYNIKTSTRTVITNTSNADLDDGYPSISEDGLTIAWESDYDHITNEPILRNNQVFAAKLKYGCPYYTNASNYVADPDVAVACEFKEPTKLKFSGKGIAITLMANMESMLSNIPFINSNQHEQQAKLCTVYLEEVKSDLAFAMQVPEVLLGIREESFKNCMKMCRKHKRINTPIDCSEEDDEIVVKIGFASADDEVFDEVYEKVGNPKSWYKVIEGLYADTSSDLWRGYLLKTTLGIRSAKMKGKKKYLLGW